MPKTYAIYMSTYAWHHSVHICKNQDQMDMTSHMPWTFHICATCAPRLSLQPHHYEEHNRTILPLWCKILATLFSVTSGLVSTIHVEYVDYVPELGWQFQSLTL